MKNFFFYLLNQIDETIFPIEFPYGQSMTDATLSYWNIQNDINGSNPFLFGVSRCGSVFVVGGDRNFGMNMLLSKTFSNLLPHWDIVITIDIYFLGLWNNQSVLVQADSCLFKAGQITSQTQNLPSQNLCGPSSYQTEIKRFKIRFPNSCDGRSSINPTIKFASELSLPSDQASWGINNFMLSYYLCDSSCLTCSGPQNNSCLSCYTNATLDSNNYCRCSDGYYMNLISNPCIEIPCSNCSVCLSLCQTCSSALKCDTCKAGYYLQNGLCVACNTNCLSCIDGVTCKQCFPDYFLNTIDFTFSIACPINTIIVDASCIVCPLGTFIFNNTCISSCPSDLYLFLDFCYSQCPNALIGYLGNCIVKCPNFQMDLNKSCVSNCPDDTYQLNETCYNQCPSPLLNFNKTCVGSCPLGNQNILNQTCTSCEKFMLQNGSCVSVCPYKFYNASNNICQSCDSSCLTCIGPNVNDCISCDETTFLTTNFTCDNTCPETFFEDLLSRNCVSCQDNCQICTNNLTCTKCKEKFTLINGVCKDSFEMKAQLLVLENPFSFKIRCLNKWDYFLSNYNTLIANISINQLQNNADYQVSFNPNKTNLYYDLDILIHYSQIFPNNSRTLAIFLKGYDVSNTSYYLYINQNLSCPLQGISIICSNDQYFSPSII